MTYALKLKNKFVFTCVAKTPELFENKINNSYNSWRGLQGKGTNLTIDDFLSTFDKVIITIEPYEEK